jgi:N-acetylglucosaminyldiphosphoundecaprenol N-acetyl-beta-D-mannosaminyltransferase
MPTDGKAAILAGDVGAAPDARLAYFGTHITPRTFPEWLAGISDMLATGQRGWLSGSHNLHSLYLLQRNSDVRRFYARCNDCYIDGTSVRLILNGFKVPTSARQRFSLMDHFLDLLQHAQNNSWSVFFLGSRESAVNTGSGIIKKMFPELRIKFQHGYSSADPALVHAINEFRPDILLVGMGMPLQERWLLRHLDHLDVGFVAQAGGTLDYYTGAQAKPPLWMSRSGCAWLYRLVNDPLRLWRRYLLEPCVMLYPTLRQWYRYQRLL